MPYSPARLRASIAPISTRETARACLGAAIGILATGIIARAALGPGAAVPLLIAPMGASAVLLFAAPASALAQPWSLLGGNTVSALAGVTCAMLIADPVVAAALAIGAAIALMRLLGCLHPPSGAVALTAVLGGPAVADAGYAFVLWPVGLNSLVLLGAALTVNNLTGRPYPHRTPAPSEAVRQKEKETARSDLLMTIPPDLDAVLRQYDEVVDVSPDQLDRILSQAQIRAYQRKAGQITAGAIMSPAPVTVRPQTPLHAAWTMLCKNDARALPVIADDATLVGIVSQSDFLKAGLVSPDGRYQRSGVSKLDVFRKARLRKVEDVMTRNVRSALPEVPLARLVAPMAEDGLHQVPIVNGHNRVVGMVTQADLLAALFRHGIDETPEHAQSAAA